MLHEYEIDRLRRDWIIETPTDDLADRIVAHATSLPQRRRAAFLPRLLHVLSIPSPALAMRGMAVAACLMVAVIAVDGTTPMGKSPLSYKAPTEKLVEDLFWSEYDYY